MNIAIPSAGETLDSAVEARFGRCPFFLIVNPATLAFEVVPNKNAGLGGGSGIQSAAMIAEENVSVVLTGSCGPNALQVLEEGGIHVITGVSGTVGQAVQQFAAGSLKTAQAGRGLCWEAGRSASGKPRDKRTVRGMGRGPGGGCDP